MMRELSFILFFILFFPSLPLFSQTETLIQFPSLEYHIQEINGRTDLPNLNWIIEEGESLLFPTNLSIGKTKDATIIDLSKDPTFNLKSHYNYWFSLRLISDKAIDTLGLAFYQNGNCWDSEFTFKEVEAYIHRTSDGMKRVGLTGGRLGADKRDFSNILNPSLVRLGVADNDTLDVWVKLSKGEACRLKIGLVAMGHEEISKPRGLNLNSISHLLLSGANITLFIIGLLLFLWFRDRVYLWFMLFQISLVAFSIPYEFKNEIFATFFQKNPWTQILFITFVRMFNVFALFHFGRLFIDTKTKFPRIYQIIGWAIWGFVVLSCLGVFFRVVPSEIASVWFFLRQFVLAGIFGSLLGCLVYLIFTKDKLAQVYSIGILLPVIVVIHRIIVVNFTHNPGEWEISLMINSGMVLMMTLALAYRFQRISIEKKDALKAKMDTELQFKEQGLRMDIASRFFSNITHEFRTPLTLILEPVRQILKKRKLGKEELNEKLILVKDNSEKLLDMVNQLLDISKIEADKMEVSLRRGNLFDIVQPIFHAFLFLAEKKGVLMKMKMKKEIDLFYFDKNKLERIVYNLLSNAVKFTEKGEIVLELEQRDINSNSAIKDPQLVIRVSDTGVGIAANQLPFIFDRFYQVDLANDYGRSGTGLGLSLVKELTELLGGTVQVDSQPNKGTLFEVLIPIIFEVDETALKSQKFASTEDSIFHSENKLPVLKELNSQLDIKDNTPTFNEGDSRPVVLLVEDNSELRTFLKASLQSRYQIIEASNGEKGIERAKEILPDLIVSDVMMPHKNGFELTHEIKHLELTSHIPIILLTAKSTADSKIKGLKTGADAYLTKPFDTEELLIRIEKLIEIRTILQEKYRQGIPLKNSASDMGFSHIDQEFMRKITLIINDGMTNPNFSVEYLASQIFMSRSQLFRKIKALTGATAIQFIRNIRLDKAHELLQNKEGNIGEVALLVGFNDDRYFSKKFKERFGFSPSELH